MPYIRHEDGFDAAHDNHNATNSTLGGFDQLVRCRGHYPERDSCDDIFYAWVPDEDVCENCNVVSETEYDDFASLRVGHIYEHTYLPALTAELHAVDTRLAELSAVRGLVNGAQAPLWTEYVNQQRHGMEAKREEIARLLASYHEEHEQVKRDIAAPGDSVRLRRARQAALVGASTGKDGQ